MKASKKETMNSEEHGWGGTRKQYAITTLIGLAMSIGFSMAQGFSLEASLKLNMRSLSDGFFVASMLIGGIGALVWVSTTGFFDILAYAGRNLQILLSSLWRHNEHMTYIEYKAMRDEKRGRVKAFLLVVAAFLLAIAVLVLCIYYAI